MYLRKYEGFIYKINSANPLKTTIETARYHYEKTIQPITKCFTDSSNENFKLCSPYAAILAWANQFCHLVIESK